MNPAYPFFAKYGKSVLAAGFLVYAAVVAQLSGDGRVDKAEAVTIAIAVCSALLVYVVPMAPQWRWGKSTIMAVSAGLVIAAQLIVDGALDTNDWYLVIGAVVAALGVTIAPAVSPTPNGSQVPDVVVPLGADVA